MHLGTVVGIGWRAALALDGERLAKVLAPMRASIYVVVNDEILWLGGPTDVMHSRTVQLSRAPDASGVTPSDTVSIAPWAVDAWQPAKLIPGPSAAAALRRGADRLAKTALALGEPSGFGAWLVARPLAFPLADAGASVTALADACATDDAGWAAGVAPALLGLGSGLTPSGDDFVGGAFFARAALAQLDDVDGAPWHRAASTVRAAASGATNAISAALLGDLLDGHGWSPLHDLAAALAAANESAAMEAASRLTRLGHSSGWDLLAGFVSGARR